MRPDPVAPTLDAATYRHVLGHLPTGVVVITASGPPPVGMACNSFASVSLDPALVLFCAASTSETWPTIRSTGAFCVNVMASHHADLTRAFARKGVDRFEGVAHHERHGGPGIDDAVAWIDCDIETIHPAGDHDIVVGAVRHLEVQSSQDPLVFWRAGFASLQG
jgi:3-hydroxy-9,10-secoandrosta-1,3,5(10)-triene-9,17-dione monooxygenase reductase component